MIYFSCPKCGTRLSADPASIGKAVLCGKCKQQVIVPKPPVAVKVDPSSATGTQPSLPSKMSERHPMSWLPGQKKAALAVVAVVVIVILGSAVSVGLALRHKQSQSSGEKPDSPTRKLYERGELSRKLEGMTMSEVRQLLGDPDASYPMMGEKNGVVWTYHNITLDPDSRTPDPIWQIVFIDYRVKLSFTR